MGDLATTGGGPALARAGLPRIVHLPGGRAIQVRPPTVRDAMEILEALPGAVAGDAGDEQVLEEALVRWLPDEVLAWWSVLTPSAMDQMLRGLLFQGADLERMRKRSQSAQRHEKKQEPSERQPDWRLALADYCQIYGAGDPWHVYTTTPWPFFLSLLDVSGAASARELIRWVEVEVLPHTGKGATKALERLRRRAQDEHEGVGDGFGAYAPPDVIAREREELRAQLSGGTR